MGEAEKDLKKVGIYVDEKTWKGMKDLTFRKYGTTRKLSGEVREILRPTFRSES